MSQNESTPFLVTDAKNLTLIDANRENSPWWSKLRSEKGSSNPKIDEEKKYVLKRYSSNFQYF